MPINVSRFVPKPGELTKQSGGFAELRARKAVFNPHETKSFADIDKNLTQLERDAGIPSPAEYDKLHADWARRAEQRRQTGNKSGSPIISKSPNTSEAKIGRIIQDPWQIDPPNPGFAEGLLEGTSSNPFAGSPLSTEKGLSQKLTEAKSKTQKSTEPAQAKKSAEPAKTTELAEPAKTQKSTESAQATKPAEPAKTQESSRTNSQSNRKKIKPLADDVATESNPIKVSSMSDKEFKKFAKQVAKNAGERDVYIQWEPGKANGKSPIGDKPVTVKFEQKLLKDLLGYGPEAVKGAVMPTKFPIGHNGKHIKYQRITPEKRGVYMPELEGCDVGIVVTDNGKYGDLRVGGNFDSETRTIIFHKIGKHSKK